MSGFELWKQGTHHRFVFRTLLQSTLKFSNITAKMIDMNVRTLDFTKFTGTDQERKEFCQGFLDGITDIGFVKLINHGLDDKTNSELFQQVVSTIHLFHLVSSITDDT